MYTVRLIFPIIRLSIVWVSHNIMTKLIGGDLVRERFAYLERNENYRFAFESGESTAQVYPGEII